MHYANSNIYRDSSRIGRFAPNPNGTGAIIIISHSNGLLKKQDAIAKMLPTEHRLLVRNSFANFNLLSRGRVRKSGNVEEAMHGTNVAMRVAENNGKLYNLSYPELADGIIVATWHDVMEDLGVDFNQLCGIIEYKNAKSVDIGTNRSRDIGDYAPFMIKVATSQDKRIIIAKFHDKIEHLHDLMTGFNTIEMVEKGAIKGMTHLACLINLSRTDKRPLHLDAGQMAHVLATELIKFANRFGLHGMAERLEGIDNGGRLIRPRIFAGDVGGLRKAA